MSASSPSRVAVVDYGMGNLFSVVQACQSAGLNAQITYSPEDIATADAVILPGVGAFQDAMQSLKARGLDVALEEVAARNVPLVGVCLGMQLLLERSYEFGDHRGLGLIQGEVSRLKDVPGAVGLKKVPHVGWNQLKAVGSWDGSLLDGLKDGTFMYFVHSYYVRPQDQGCVMATTRHGDFEFCSVLQQGNIFACQGHPERSGSEGLRIYQNLARQLELVRAEG